MTPQTGDSQRQCRYCYEDVNDHQNVSACWCNSLLCHQCMQNELLLTSGRGNHIAKCSICHFEYSVTRRKSIIRQLYYWWKCAKFTWVSIQPTLFTVQFPDWVMILLLIFCGLWIASTTALDITLRRRTILETTSSIYLNVTSSSVITMIASQCSFGTRFVLILEYLARCIALFQAHQERSLIIPSEWYQANDLQISYIAGCISSTVFIIVILSVWLSRDIYEQYRIESRDSTETVFVENYGPFTVHV